MLDTSGRVVAAVSCAILLVMASAILARVREGPLKNAPGRLVTALAWFTTIYAALAVVLNLATQSSSERAVFAPTAILLVVLVVTTMVGSRDGEEQHGRAKRAVEASRGYQNWWRITSLRPMSDHEPTRVFHPRRHDLHEDSTGCGMIARCSCARAQCSLRRFSWSIATSAMPTAMSGIAIRRSWRL